LHGTASAGHHRLSTVFECSPGRAGEWLLQAGAKCLAVVQGEPTVLAGLAAGRAGRLMYVSPGGTFLEEIVGRRPVRPDMAESMHFDFQLGTLLLGIVICLARIVDVSMGTMRTISIVQGRTRIAFVLGFLEVSIWLMVISAVVNDVMTKPLLGIFYALGFSTGNVVGIKLERRLAFGHIIFRVISTCNGRKIADTVRDSGYAVTTFEGEGKCGPVTMLYVVCRRRDLNEIIPLVKSIEPDAFYITEHAGSVSKIFRPALQPLTGWRAIFKKK
jgi:uncharacterized protein YebE (UPF0316 family)